VGRTGLRRNTLWVGVDWRVAPALHGQ
jgi:hypothetical protein